MAHLEIVEGPGKGQTLPLLPLKTIVGRPPECDIEVSSPAADWYHAQIVDTGGSCFLDDMQSRHGTFVNDQRVLARIKLNDGDLIRVADTVFCFREGEFRFPAGETTASAYRFGDEGKEEERGGEELPAELRRAIDQLSEQEREIVFMRWLKKLSYAEIAAELGIGQLEAHQRLARALVRIRGIIRGEGPM